MSPAAWKPVPEAAFVGAIMVGSFNCCLPVLERKVVKQAAPLLDVTGSDAEQNNSFRGSTAPRHISQSSWWHTGMQNLAQRAVRPWWREEALISCSKTPEVLAGSQSHSHLQETSTASRMASASHLYTQQLLGTSGQHLLQDAIFTIGITLTASFSFMHQPLSRTNPSGKISIVSRNASPKSVWRGCSPK